MTNNRTIWDDIRLHILSHFEKALIESFTELSQFRSEWLTPSVILGCISGPIWKMYSKENITNSLTCRKITEWQRSVIWMYLAAYSGSYESIGRELRFILEDVCQSVFLDTEYDGMSIEYKLGKINTGLRGQNLIRRLHFSEELDEVIAANIKNRLDTLRKEFNSYIHPSVEIVQQAIEHGKFIFKMDDALFKQLLVLFSETMDLLLAVILDHFPDTIEIFLEVETFGTPMKHLIFHSAHANTLAVCNFHSPETFLDSYFGYYSHDDGSSQ